MDTNLLRSWLGLTSGDWPPDPHALLGPPDGVQERALNLMERLRPHQLRHPELVTEGMNRLAQALIAVEESERITISAAETATATPPVVVLDAEVVEHIPFAEATPVLKAVLAPRKRAKPTPSPAAVVVEPESEPIVAIPLTGNHRKRYRKLVQVRRLVRTWHSLGPLLGVPSQGLTTSGDVYNFLDTILNCRKALKELNSWPLKHGRYALSIIQYSNLSLFRSLQPFQREAIATDWAKGFAQLQSWEHSLRQSNQANRPPVTLRDRTRCTQNWMRLHPEWMLALLLSMAATAAMLRSMFLSHP